MPENGGVKFTAAIGVLVLALSGIPVMAQQSGDQGSTLEARQPLELMFADSIVPQDRHEMMLTTGARYFRHDNLRDSFVTQKVEWGISDRFQISTFANPL